MALLSQMSEFFSPPVIAVMACVVFLLAGDIVTQPRHREKHPAEKEDGKR